MDQIQPLILVGPGKLGITVLKVASMLYPAEYDFWCTAFGRTPRALDVGKRHYRVGSFEEAIDEAIPSLIQAMGDIPPIVVDCSKGAPLANAKAYAKLGLNFVMLTTGDGIKDVPAIVKQAKRITCVQDVNMSAELMSLYGAIQREAEKNYNGFRGCLFSIVESHQASKIKENGEIDVSGTALKIADALVSMGAEPADIFPKGIESIRDPKEQISRFSVPEKYLDAHAIHQIDISSLDRSVVASFGSRVLGRETYANGTLELALPFLQAKIAKGETGHFTMADVLAYPF